MVIDFVSLSIFLGAFFCLGVWIILKSLRYKLRDPPKNFEKFIASSVTKQAPLPAAIKTPVVRRQIILSSKNPSMLSNLLEMNTDTISTTNLVKRPLIYGFLHPNAYAAGGGERVLWAAIKQLVHSDSKAVAAIYYGPQKGVTPAMILERAGARFGIKFEKAEIERIVFIGLTQARLVDASNFPFLTLICQSIGMAMLGYEAISNLMPDVFVDTTGLAFSYPVVSWFASVPIVSYVHFPFVQQEMLKSVKAKGLLNPKHFIKYFYYLGLNVAYKWAGSYSNVVCVNSSWTKKYLNWRQAKSAEVVYPPCAVQDFEKPKEDVERTPALVYVAQFRPEKRHDLVIEEFAKAKNQVKSDKSINSKNRKPHLILLGSVRDEVDAVRVQALRALAIKLGLTDNDITIVENAPWEAIQKILSTSLIGLNAMWNEHFGMGVVEVMAAGLIPVVHASAGPLMDIVKDEEGQPGFFFRSEEDPDGLGLNGYPTLADAMIQALKLSPEQQKEYSMRCYNSAQRFSDAVFAEHWQQEMDLAKELEKQYHNKRKALSLYD